MIESGTSLSFKKPQITLAEAIIQNTYTSKASYIIFTKLGDWYLRHTDAHFTIRFKSAEKNVTRFARILVRE